MMNRTYGYARVSTKEQNLDRQLKALHDAGVEDRDILIDKQSGKDFNRQSYKMMTEKLLREGDTLVVLSIDRLGRNYTEIREQWELITKTIGANVKVIDMPLLDTTNTENLDSRFIADLVLQILSYVAEKERENTRKRQRQGIDVMPIVNGKKVSNKTGRATGRPSAKFPENWTEIYNQWKADQITAVKAMEILNLTKSTFYNLVKRYEAKSNA